jgi:glutamine synthetase
VGIEDKLVPPAPITGNAYEQELPQVPTTWKGAIDRFADSPIVRRIFDQQLIDNLVRTKRQEMDFLDGMSPEDQLDHYLDLV